jgi:nanoRNase/pAp phosphatase (c-di-AMP/oligoRNAs hydrolase)
MTISAAERLRRFYSLFSSDDQVLIVINADPDAIASAMAVKRLLWRKVAGVTLCNINVIERPDNVAMCRLLGARLVPIGSIDAKNFSRFITVDSQPSHHEAFSGFKFDAIIDHHPETGAKAPFLDIRPKYGATATIMTEYLRAAKIKPAVKLATALFHAIKTDTRNFERQTIIEDIRAFQFLFKHVNIYLARKIEESDLRLDFLGYFECALKTRRMRKGRVFVHLGPVKNPDICVLIADFFMRVASVRWSIVSGVYNKKLVIVFRNDGLRKNAGKVAKESFAQIGSAGGHRSAARAEILVSDLERLLDYRDHKKLLRWIIAKIEKKTEKNCTL